MKAKQATALVVVAAVLVVGGIYVFNREDSSERGTAESKQHPVAAPSSTDHLNANTADEKAPGTGVITEGAATSPRRTSPGTTSKSDIEEVDATMQLLKENPDLMSQDARDMAALFASEKRDEGWASAKERSIATEIAQASIKGGKVLNVPYVRCAATICEIRAVNYPVSAESPFDWQNMVGRFTSGESNLQLSHGATTMLRATDNRRTVYVSYLTR